MDEIVAKALAKTIVRIVVDLPFALLVIRAWVWCGAFETFKLPTPTWKQTWGIVIMALAIT